MAPGRRRLLALGGILLGLGVLVAGLAVLTVVALPLALGIGLAVCTFVVALGTRLQHGPWSRRTGRTRVPSGGHGLRRPPAPRWTTQWESVPPPDAVPASRHRLTVALAEWGLVGAAAEPVLLVVTELLSNAVDHGRGPVRLAVEHSDQEVHVEVHDGAPAPPRLQPQDLQRTRGRGLQLVEGLSSRWGWADDPPGKVVWADVPAGRPAPPGAGTGAV